MRTAAIAALALASWTGPATAQDGRLDDDAVSVRVLLGVDDEDSRSWDGRASLDRGEVVRVTPWRFREGDRIVDGASWEAHSLPIRQGQRQPAGRPSSTGTSGDVITPTGVVVTLDAPEDATLTIATDHGDATFALADLRDGPVAGLGGSVSARIAPTHAPLVEADDEQDFPAAASDGRGGAWVAYLEHEPVGRPISEALTERPKSFQSFIPEGGGDRIRLLHFSDGRPGEPMDVTDGGLDAWRPARRRRRRTAGSSSSGPSIGTGTGTSTAATTTPTPAAGTTSAG